MQLMDQLNKVFSECTITKIVRFHASRNMTYHVFTNHDSVVVKIAPIENSGGLHWEFEVIKHWYCCKGDVAKPLREAEIEIDGTKYCVKVYSFLEGQELMQSELTGYSFGKSLASLHLAWKEGKNTFTIPSYKKPMDIETLRDSLDSIEQLCGSIQDFTTIRRYVDQVGEFLEKNQEKELFCMTHGDAHFKNVRIQQDDRIQWFDFEDACFQWRAYDLATAIWSTYGSNGDATIWNAIIEGYCSITELQDCEYPLINRLIFARHLWWLGLNAKHWDEWKLPYTKRYFFKNGLNLLIDIAQSVCGLE